MSVLSYDSIESDNLCNVELEIEYEEDLICKYNLMNYEAQEGDRIAIFKLGWQFLKDYVLFEWVSGKSGSVIFKEENLPKDVNEIYQLCYITGDNGVLGVSKPIELNKKVFSMYQSSLSTYRDSISSCSNISESETVPITQLSQDNIINQLKTENLLLKDILKVVVKSKKIENFEKELQDLKVLTKTLNEIVISQQNEIDFLKSSLSKVLNSSKNCNNVEKKLLKDDFDLGDLKSIPPIPILK